MTTTTERSELLAFALELARLGGATVMPLFRSENLATELKADRTPVTEADRRAEEAMRALIEARYPEHEILGEELGHQERGASHRWILDPIDGTVSFMNGVPLFAILVGLEIDGEPIIGVAHFPAVGETVWAERGKGCFWNDAPAKVRRCERLADALISTSGMHATDIRARSSEEPLIALGALIRKVKDHRGWSDAYGHCLVATGRLDAMIDPRMAPWDSAAIIPILEEAGGTVTSLSGSRERLTYAGSLISTAGGIHDEVLGVLGGEGVS